MEKKNLFLSPFLFDKYDVCIQFFLLNNILDWLHVIQRLNYKSILSDFISVIHYNWVTNVLSKNLKGDYMLWDP